MLSHQIDQWQKILGIFFGGSLTWEHTKRVCKLTHNICISLNISKRISRKLYTVALFHDIGLIHQLYNNDGTHPENLGDLSYFLFLKIHADHEIAELIRHIHCTPKAYFPRHDEPKRGYPEETCKLLNKLPESLQLIQLCHEWDVLDNWSDKDPYTEIRYLAANGRWDRELTDNFLKVVKNASNQDPTFRR